MDRQMAATAETARFMIPSNGVPRSLDGSTALFAENLVVAKGHPVSS